MAKDDYHVIVYQILAYLYQCLKNDKPVEDAALRADSALVAVNERYWKYIIINLSNSELIVGVKFTKVWGDVLIDDLSGTMITPKGIEYLSENLMMKKAYKIAKEVREFLPLP